MSQGISRRNFLTGAGVVAGLATVPGLASIANATTVKATAGAAIPYPYVQLDAEAVALRGYEIYWSSYCGEGCFYSIVEALAAKDPTGPWAAIPQNMFRYAYGGADGWGTLCGSLNGSLAVNALMGAPGAISDALMVWYAQAAIPSTLVNDAAAGGWTPTAPAKAPLPAPVTSVSGSQLCHISLSKWLTASGNIVGSANMSDRCGKLVADVVKKNVEMLNAWKADGTLPTVTLAPSVAACKSCHGTNSYGEQECLECHTDKASGHPTTSATPTALSIASSATSVTRGRQFTLSGLMTPSPATVGQTVHVDVKKPGRTYFSYSSARTLYAGSGGASSWQYKYNTLATQAKGTYEFQVVFDGNATYAPFTSATQTVTFK